jgi:hypothetical protein
MFHFLALVLGWFSGCVSRPHPYERNFGRQTDIARIAAGTLSRAALAAIHPVMAAPSRQMSDAPLQYGGRCAGMQ